VGANTQSIFFCLKHEIEQMRQNGGAIVNNTSVLGIVLT
jgi:hypothetical protein